MFALSELVDSDDGGALRTSIGQVAAACHAMGAVQCVRSNATLMQLVDQVHKMQVQHQIGDAPDK